MKRFFGLFGLLGAAAAVLFFWKRNKSDDEFLDEELE
ncbi:MAG: LPXTG cell wall anchor domain-containing protein [Tepidiformaceae bacterium]